MTEVIVSVWWIGWVKNSNLVPGLATPGTESMCAEDTSLLHATRTIADCAADYRFVYSTSYRLLLPWVHYSRLHCLPSFMTPIEILERQLGLGRLSGTSYRFTKFMTSIEITNKVHGFHPLKVDKQFASWVRNFFGNY